MTVASFAHSLMHRPALPGSCRPTYVRHLAWAILDGTAAGVLANAPIMALKAIGSPGWQLALQMSISAVGMFMVLYLGALMAKRRKMPFVVLPGLLQAIAMLVMAFTRDALAFLLLLGLGTLFETVARPAVAAIIRRNYPADARGAATGEIRRWNSLAFLSSAAVSALLLDAAGENALLMVKCQILSAGLLIGLGYLIFSSIAVNEAPTELASEPSLPAIREVARILSRDGRFRRYLAIGFLYCFGGMLYVSFTPVLFTRQLEMGYFGASLLTHIIPSLLAFLSTGVIGRWIDRVNTWKAWAWIRLGWGVDPIILAAAPAAGALAPWAGPALSVAARTSRGTVMGGSWILWWQLGVTHFAPPGGDTTRYMGLVLFVNGLARLLGPAIGALLLHHYSMQIVLLAGGAFVLFSSAFSALEYLRERAESGLSTIEQFEKARRPPLPG